MNVTIIQPPLVQLNSPYPSGAYLTNFFREQKCDVVWQDLSLKLFYSIFSEKGLTKLFSLSQSKALKMADDFEKQGQEDAAFNLRRYVSSKEQWISWIDFIVGILCNKKDFSARELSHKFLFSPFSPRGNRMEQYLLNLEKEPTVDDVRFLCSFAIADLADYITTVFDNEFSLIRYAEHLTVDTSTFGEIEKKLDSPVLCEFYESVLEENINIEKNQKHLFLITIPFAGTFLSALYTAKFLKEKYGNNAFIIMGGGFVNTELREQNQIELSKYINGFSFDRGYGSYLDFFEKYNNSLDVDFKNAKPLYKMRQFFLDGVVEPVWEDNKIQLQEDKITVQNFPDFSDIDFSLYPRLCDDKNAMHRMWSDGAWIKAYLAHGCYWHKCSFCDTQLDYVCAYKITNVKDLFFKLLSCAKEKGVYGIHFVDEALPPKALKEFALLNAQNQNKLYYWGNIRFEKSFTKDFAAFLSYCGFGNVSGGIENATYEGLQTVNKGTDISSIISSCAAFKESGILIHAYMIYGFWNDTALSIINSMETLRQMFNSGLLDSAFWHKFVLTKNSTAFMEYKKGLHKELKVYNQNNKEFFAQNNLSFEGENEFNKYGNGLELALQNWMHGQKLNMNVQKWFDFSVPKPTIPQDFVEQQINLYEQNNNLLYKKQITLEDLSNAYFLGSTPIRVGKDKLRWIYLQEEIEETFTNVSLDDLCTLVYKLNPTVQDKERSSVLEQIKKSPELMKSLQKFRGIGLVII